MPSKKSLPPGAARILPTEVRIRLVDAASDARNTHFSHMSCMMCSLATAPKLPPANTSSDGAHAVRHLAVAFAEIDRLHRRELNYLARLVQRRRDRAEPAEHALGAEFRIERVEVVHAVEQRDDRGFRADGGREGFDRILEIERLAAQQHDVEFFGELVGLHRGRIFQRDVAVRALDDKPGARELAPRASAVPER